METFLMYFLFAVGLVLIIKGGDFFVDAAAWLAEVSGIPHFIVGATIVGFATSLPEILVSVFAAAGGDVEMATGNAVGSVTANTGLILGISLLAMPMVIRLRKYYPQVILLTAAIVAIFLFGLSGEITIVASIVLTLMFVLFVIMNVRDAKSSISENAEAVAAERENITKGIVAKKIVLFVLGCAGIIGGSELLVNYGSAIAASLGVPLERAHLVPDHRRHDGQHSGFRQHLRKRIRGDRLQQGGGEKGRTTHCRKGSGEGHHHGGLRPQRLYLPRTCIGTG